MKTSTDDSPAVTVQYAAPGENLPREVDFRAWVAAALAGERPDAEVCIRLVDAAEGRALNREYRGRDYATNVLSFPVELPPGVASPLLGDLAICVPVVLAEARDADREPRAHFAHLTVHGILHLLGHDHEAEPQAEAMEARETAILAELGFPDPYGGSRIESGQNGGDVRTPS